MAENTDPGEITQYSDEQRKMLEDLMFRTIMNYSQDSIYFKDCSCRFIMVNTIKAKRHGVDNPDKMIGKTDFDYIAEDTARVIHEAEMQIMSNHCHISRGHAPAILLSSITTTMK